MQNRFSGFSPSEKRPASRKRETMRVALSHVHERPACFESDIWESALAWTADQDDALGKPETAEIHHAKNFQLFKVTDIAQRHYSSLSEMTTKRYRISCVLSMGCTRVAKFLF